MGKRKIKYEEGAFSSSPKKNQNLGESSPKKKNYLQEDSQTRETTPTASLKLESSFSTPKMSTVMVPWSGRNEWENVRDGIHQNNNEFVIEELSVWQGRVGSLPMGAEVTLYVLLAIRGDKARLEKDPKYNEVEGRALFIMAINRFMNNIGYFAATILGEKTSLSMQTLSTSVKMDVPQWFINLRNEISHGTSVVLIETLVVAGNYMLTWLKEYYWVVSIEEENMLEENNTKQNELSELISIYLASKVYSDRKVDKIPIRPEFQRYIPQHLPATRKSWDNKEKCVEVGKLCASLETKLITLIKEGINDKDLICSSVAESMCQTEFFLGLGALCNDPFAVLAKYWEPILKALKKKKMLYFSKNGILFYLCEIHTASEDDSGREDLSARWIQKIVNFLEENGKIRLEDVGLLLKEVLLNPNHSSERFMQILLTLMETKVGEKVKTDLETLTKIWLDETEFVGERKDDSLLNVSTYFSVDNVSLEESSSCDNYDCISSIIAVPIRKNIPERKQYWMNKPLGNAFNDSV